MKKMARNSVDSTAVVVWFTVVVSLFAASSADDEPVVDKVDVVIDDVTNEEDGDDVAIEENVVDEVKEEEKKMTLSQIDPVEVGYVQEIDVGHGRRVQMKTVAIKPPAFEIFNLLTPDECDHMIKLGEAQGLERSMTIASDFNQRHGLYAEDGVTLAYNETEWNQTFTRYDLNLDGSIDYTELHGCLPILKDRDVELSLAQVIRLLTDLDLDSDSNGLLNLNEFWAMMTRSLEKQVDEWLGRLQAGEIVTEDNARGPHRISDQTWLQFVSTEDELLSELPYRISALTGLHPHVVLSSEKIQVARYYPGGYYHAHYDSMDIDPERNCIQSMMTLRKVDHTHPKGRICRYITIMTYLNDVEEGGETAFPLADNETYSSEAYKERESTLTDLKNHCHDGNMVIHPAKGKTVMWYNHHLHPETGWLGAKNVYSLHGGCKVTRGVKWIANNWIAVDDVHSLQMEFHEKYFAIHGKQGSGLASTTASDNINTEISTGESSTDTTDDATSSSNDVNITSSNASSAASEKAEAQQEDSIREGEPAHGHVDESHDGAAGSEELKDEL